MSNGQSGRSKRRRSTRRCEVWNQRLVIQLEAELVGGAVVPAFMAAESGSHGGLFGLDGFQALVDGVHGGLDAVEPFLNEVEAIVHFGKTGINRGEAFVHRIEAVVNRREALIYGVESLIEILVEFIPLGLVIHICTYYAPERHDGQARAKPLRTAPRKNERRY